MKKYILSIALLFLTVNLSAQQQMKYGHCSEEIAGSMGIGVRTEVKVAMRIPKATAARFAGSELTAIRVGAGQSLANEAKVFIMESLNADPVYEKDVELVQSMWNEIILDAPYVIGGDKDVYVGYSFTSGTGSNIYAIGMDGSEDGNPDAGFVSYKRASANTFTNWESMGTEANLCVIAVLEGDNLPKYDLDFMSMSLPISACNPGELVAVGTVWNRAAEAITGFDVEYSIDGGEKITIPISGVEITNYGRYQLSIPITDATEEGRHSLTLTLSNLNGHADEDESNNSQLGSFVIAQMPDAPTIVSVEPTLKNVVLEEFTGINCTYCAAGHKIANQVAEANPGRVSVINIHQGGFADATPDYRTQWGDAIAYQTGLAGYPAGTVNRHVFSGQATTLDRGAFKSSSEMMLNQASYVNVASKATINKDTRELIVDVELYYTGNSPFGENRLNIALLQDSILGPQVGASNQYPEMMVDGQYQHNHALRDMLTGQWGDVITQTSAETFIAKRYFYTIPSKFRNIPVNLDKLEVVAFLAEGRQEIITGTTAEMTRFSPTSIEAVGVEDGIRVYPNPAEDYIKVSHAERISRVEIYSISGQLIETVNSISKPIIALNNYPAGVYVFRFYMKDGTTVAKRVIIK